MAFIKLTTVEGDICIVNTENINSVLRCENSKITDIFFNNKQLLDVRETPEEILRLIKEVENVSKN